MQRFSSLFRSPSSNPRMIGYLPALYPDVATYQALLAVAGAAGLRYLEIGIPAADPYLDGAVIQRSLAVVGRQKLDLATMMRNSVTMVRQNGITGIVMLYWESVAQIGLKAFCDLAVESHADALLIPNLPSDKLGQLAHFLSGTGVKTMNFIPYEADRAEVEAIIGHTSGALYLQSRQGATGGAFHVDTALYERIVWIKEAARAAGLPIALGFGISNEDHARLAASTETDAIIVGTGFVEAASLGTEQFSRYLTQFAPYLEQEEP